MKYKIRAAAERDMNDATDWYRQRDVWKVKNEASDGCRRNTRASARGMSPSSNQGRSRSRSRSRNRSRNRSPVWGFEGERIWP